MRLKIPKSLSPDRPSRRTRCQGSGATQDLLALVAAASPIPLVPRHFFPAKPASNQSLAALRRRQAQAREPPEDDFPPRHICPLKEAAAPGIYARARMLAE